VATEAGVSSWATLGQAWPRAWSLMGAQGGGSTGDVAVAGIFCRGMVVVRGQEEMVELCSSRPAYGTVFVPLSRVAAESNG